MAIHSLNSLEMPLLASAFSSALPHVICGQPTGRECATQLLTSWVISGDMELWKNNVAVSDYASEYSRFAD